MSTADQVVIIASAKTSRATSGIFAGASMSGDLRSPSQAIPKGTLWAMLTTFIVYFVVVLSMACTISRDSLLANANIVSLTNLSQPIILAGECAVTLFSALMGILGSAKLLQALARDKLIPGLSVFGRGTRKTDEPILSIVMTYVIAQVALLADLNQIATFISMGYQVSPLPNVSWCNHWLTAVDDIFRHEPGLLSTQDWVCPKFSTKL